MSSKAYEVIQQHLKNIWKKVRGQFELHGKITFVEARTECTLTHIKLNDSFYAGHTFSRLDYGLLSLNFPNFHIILYL